jgi:hypothetical protein
MSISQHLKFCLDLVYDLTLASRNNDKHINVIHFATMIRLSRIVLLHLLRKRLVPLLGHACHLCFADNRRSNGVLERRLRLTRFIRTVMSHHWSERGANIMTYIVRASCDR